MRRKTTLELLGGKKVENEYVYKLSYVIPAYNAEYTLESCVNSIVSISPNTEAIIVNDGSIDQTLEIAKRIQNNYPDQVTIINQENSGVSAARNIGIMRARGEYVAFSDADDVIETERVRYAVTQIQPDAQVIMFNYHVIENGKWNYASLPKDILLAVDKKDAILKRLLYFRLSKKEPNSNIGGKVFQYFFRTSFLMSFDIRFSEKLSFAEDLVFCCRALQLSSIVQTIDLPIYRYFIFSGSAAHRYRENYWNELKSVYEELKTSCPMYITNGCYYYYARTALYHIIQYFKNGTISYTIAKAKSGEVLADDKVYDDFQSIKGHFGFWECCRNRALINRHCVLLVMKNARMQTRICHVLKLVIQKSKNVLNKLKYRIIKFKLGGDLNTKDSC